MAEKQPNPQLKKRKLEKNKQYKATQKRALTQVLELSEKLNQLTAMSLSPDQSPSGHLNQNQKLASLCTSVQKVLDFIGSKHKFICVGGMPATGKSSLFQKLLSAHLTPKFGPGGTLFAWYSFKTLFNSYFLTLLCFLIYRNTSSRPSFSCTGLL